MSRRAEKSLLLFSKGEVTPLLAGRTDVEPIQAGCRTLQNMLVDVEGSVTRRPGIQFVAEAKGAFEISYASLTGTGTMYGITELGDVSDPPRKYLKFFYNGLSRLTRTNSNGAVLTDVSNRVSYNTSGTRTNRFSINVTRPGASGVNAEDSLENLVYTTPHEDLNNFPPTWTRTKRVKSINPDDFGDLSSDEDPPVMGYGENRLFGNTTSSNQNPKLYIARPVWKDDHWRVTVTAEGSQQVVGTYQIRVRLSLAAGDQQPSDPKDGITILTVTVGPGSGTVSGSVNLNIAPDSSMRLNIRQMTSFVDGQPESWPHIYDADGMADADINPWLYLPSGDTYSTDAEMRDTYSENLSTEDTFYAALARGSSTAGTLSVAETTAIGGSGAEAESHVPLDITATAVQATIAVTGLIAGHLYNYTITFRDQDIGGGGGTTIQETGSFTAGGTTFNLVHQFAAPNGKTRRIIAVAVSDQGEPVTPPELEPETLAWQGEVLANGGTFEADSVELANDLIVALKAESFYGKIRYLMPLLGADLAAGITPLIGNFAFGRPTNIAFVDGDFDQATGLQGDGTTKALEMPFAPSELGSSNNGGIGIWRLTAGTTNDGHAFSMANNPGGGTRVYSIQADGTVQAFRWGLPANDATRANSGQTGFHYGQRSSDISRVLYIDGAPVASNATSDPASGANAGDLRAMGLNPTNIPTSLSKFWDGRGGLFCATDGTLSDAEVATLHTILNTFMTAAGRV